jgi:hypothetical protein
MDAPAARDLVALLERRNRTAADLARFASLAVKIEPELLRTLRLALLPGADVSAESDLWFSEIVETQGPGGIVLLPEAAALLRTEIPGGVDRAWAVVRRAHRVLPQIVRLEETIIWMALSGSKARAIEKLLGQVLSAMYGDAGRREDLSAWALRALPRLPPAARDLPAFWMLLFTANATLKSASAPAVGAPSPAVLRGLPRRLFDGAGTTFVKLEREGDTLRLRPVAAAGAATIEVPTTRPIVLEVIAASAPSAVALESAGWTEVKVAGETVRLGAVDGRSWEVTARSAPVEEGRADRPGEEDLFRGCALVVRGDRQFPGYLVAPGFVATSSRAVGGRGSMVEHPLDSAREPISVFLGGVERGAEAVAIDDEADAALLRLDATILGVQPYDLSTAGSREERWIARGLDLQGEPVVLEGPFDPATLERERPIFELPTVHAHRGLLVDSARGPAWDGLSGAPVFVGKHVVGHIRHAEGSDRVGPGFTVTRIFMSSAAAVASMLRALPAKPRSPEAEEGRLDDVERLRRACARIVSERATAGTAYLVDTDLAVTAAHVVAPDRVSGERWLPDVRLHFAAAAGRDDIVIAARVLRLVPGVDCAVLRLASVPEGIEPLRLARGGVPGGQCVVFGFLRDHLDGFAFNGMLHQGDVEREGSSRLQLHLTELSTLDLAGLSGAPVLVEGAVVGHVVEVARAAVGTGDLLACPAAAVRALLGPQESDHLPACTSVTQHGATGAAYLVAPTLAATSASLVCEVGERVVLVFREGARAAEVARLDQSNDAAILRFDMPMSIEPVELAWEARTGESWVARWPRDGVGLRLKGRVAGEVKPGTSVLLLLECPIFSRALAEGLAGAPVEVGGRVVGHLTGYVESAPDNPEFLHLHACPASAVRDLLDPLQHVGSVSEGRLYIERSADRELLRALIERRPCYVVAPRQSGKSSLLRHAAREIKQRGGRYAFVDLSFLSPQAEEDKWMRRLREIIMTDLGLQESPAKIVEEPSGQRWEDWAYDLLQSVRRFIEVPPVVIFDEIECVLGMPFQDQFLAALTTMASDGSPLIPCLVSVLWPEDLMLDSERVDSFQQIHVDDFRRMDVRPMIDLLRAATGHPERLLDAVFSWTDGHAYLTNFLCSALLEAPRYGFKDEEERVAEIVRDRLLGSERAGASTFALVSHVVRSHPQRDELLGIYRRVLRGERVPLQFGLKPHRALLSVGLCKARDQALRIRNRIYEAAFDEAWIKEVAVRGDLA